MFQNEKRRFFCLCSIFMVCFTLYHIRKNECLVPPTIAVAPIEGENVSVTRATPISTTSELMRTDPNNISCHYWTEGDALPSAEDARFAPPPDSIFFHETSCRGGLNSRQACAVESAARAHPARKIYVLFSAPITANILTFTSSSVAELKRCPNVEFARVHIDAYAKGTILEKLLKNKTHNSSKWRVVHTSDMLRFLTLYKFGGLYLDTDFVVAKSMDGLGRNWLARESDAQLNNAAANIAKDELGREFVKRVLEELSTSYRPDLWSHNGPGVLNRVLTKFCNTSEVVRFSSSICHGFEVYGPELIYPINYASFKKYFEAGDLPNLDKPYAFHMWNKMSQDVEVQINSPYDKLGKQHCPMIHELYGDSFGY